MGRILQKEVKKATKKDLALELGVSRASLYYHPKRPAKDLGYKEQIGKVLALNPSYGHKRIALALGRNKKLILRIMKAFNLKPYKRRIKRLVKKEDLGKVPSAFKNEIKGICPLSKNVIWVSDFTYIKFEGSFVYLATVMDLYSREVIGWTISIRHNQDLILSALRDALRRAEAKPLYVHSDQGSEYNGFEYMNLCQSLGIKVSMSAKSSPWENAYQESFYSQFKVDLGDPHQFESLEELVEGIHLAINYYNRERIHTSLKMSPEEFALKGRRKVEEIVSKVRGT